MAKKPTPTIATTDLAAQIVALQLQLAQQSQLEDPNLWANTMHAEGVKRAILVAAMGGHTVLFIGPESPRAVTLAAQLGVASVAYPSCDRPHHKPSVAAWMKRLSPMFAKFDMHVEAPATSSKQERPGTSLAYAQQNLAQARVDQPKSKPAAMPMSDGGALILRQASGELGFNQMQRETVTMVARTIARIGGEATVDVSHVAEAVQYCLDRRI